MLLGNMAFGSISSTVGLVRQFRTTCMSFGMLDDNLTGTLTLLEAHECCFAGADLPTIGSAHGLQRRRCGPVRNPTCQECSDAGRGRVIWDASEAFHGCNGVVGRFGTEGAARVVALALLEEHRHT
jgi:hypothetical protein